MRTVALAAATAASAALAIAAAPWALDLPVLAFVFKPLTTLLVIAFAWTRADNAAGARRWLLAGLVASLAGDVALLWPREGFVPGLVCFLVAHLLYLRAFTRDAAFFRSGPLAFAVYAVVAGALLARLWPGVPTALHGAVIAYVLCLAAMAAQSAARARLRREPLAWRAAAGGALFVASDALLAFDRFATPLPMASLCVLATYWSAQWCIAASLPVTRDAGAPARAPGRAPAVS